MADFKTIIYEVKDKVAHITLNRPEKLNALSLRLREEVLLAVKTAERDEGVGCVLIKGNGRAFSAGYDLTASGSENSPEGGYFSPMLDKAIDGFSRHATQTWTSLWRCPKVIIGQAHGYAIAGGTELLSQCDIILVADDTLIGYPPVRAQNSPDVQWGPWRLPMAKAMYVMLTGKPFTGKQAADWGMATMSFPADQLPAEAEKLAKQITNIPIDQLALLKRSVHRAYEIMGYFAAIDAGADVHNVGGHRPSAGEFSRLIRERGLKAALAWRDGPWGDYSVGGLGR